MEGLLHQAHQHASVHNCRPEAEVTKVVKKPPWWQDTGGKDLLWVLYLYLEQIKKVILNKPPHKFRCKVKIWIIKRYFLEKVLHSIWISTDISQLKASSKLENDLFYVCLLIVSAWNEEHRRSGGKGENRWLKCRSFCCFTHTYEYHSGSLQLRWILKQSYKLNVLWKAELIRLSFLGLKNRSRVKEGKKGGWMNFQINAEKSSRYN